MDKIVKHIYKISIVVGIIFTLNFTSCSTVLGGKVRPEYPGIDPRVENLQKEYMWLSDQRNIRFYHLVTVGFKNINEGNTVGLCNYGPFFREIDIDTNYWNRSTNTTRMTLLFHEWTHCYCYREHDYGDGKKYSSSVPVKVFNDLKWLFTGNTKDGFWDDGCPISIMYPVIVNDNCMRTHYSEYTKEIFDRCKPF